MVLTNLLPGLRDLRAPLATGYLWIAAAWVLLRSVTPTDRLGVLVGDVERLATHAGVAATIAAFTFVAYLIGVVATLDQIPRVMKRAVDRFGEETGGLYLQERRGKSQFVDRVIGWLGHVPSGRDQGPSPYKLASERVNPLDDPRVDGGVLVEASLNRLLLPAGYVTPWEVDIRHLHSQNPSPNGRAVIASAVTGRLAQMVDDELPALANRLQLERESMFDRFDRMAAESEFRIACALPLVGLTLALTFTTREAWMLSGLLIAGLLLAHGIRRGFASRALMWEALDQGIIKSNVLDIFWRGVQALVGDVPAEGNFVQSPYPF